MEKTDNAQSDNTTKTGFSISIYKTLQGAALFTLSLNKKKKKEI